MNPGGPQSIMLPFNRVKFFANHFFLLVKALKLVGPKNTKTFHLYIFWYENPWILASIIKYANTILTPATILSRFSNFCFRWKLLFKSSSEFVLADTSEDTKPQASSCAKVVRTFVRLFKQKLTVENK